jgi:hypothetical protein
MIATVHVADLGIGGTVRTLLKRPKAEAVPGLRWADAASLVDLAATKPPSFRRAALFAFWDDERAVDAFEADHPVAARFADGFRTRLRPVRAFGSWPGLPEDVPRPRAVEHDGPVVVLTLGMLHLTQLVRFLRTSRPAERAAREAQGLVWGTASARPPFVATISVWESADATRAYAYGDRPPSHDEAIVEQRRKDFHRRSAFVRFAPVRVEGALRGRNPLEAAAVQV